MGPSVIFFHPLVIFLSSKKLEVKKSFKKRPHQGGPRRIWPKTKFLWIFFSFLVSVRAPIFYRYHSNRSEVLELSSSNAFLGKIYCFDIKRPNTAASSNAGQRQKYFHYFEKLGVTCTRAVLLQSLDWYQCSHWKFSSNGAIALVIIITVTITMMSRYDFEPLPPTGKSGKAEGNALAEIITGRLLNNIIVIKSSL